MISVIIPVLNDVQGLRRTLQSLVPEKEGQEILVTDGGSIDGSVELAESFPWVTLLRGVPNRGIRLNEATSTAQGDVLLFLNPGTTLERGWPPEIEKAAGSTGFALGYCRLHYDSSLIQDRLLEAFAWVRARLLRFPFGNQALFIRKSSVVEGRLFLDIPALEDVELVRRMRGSGRVVPAGVCAVNPGDRPETGSVLRQIWRELRLVTGLLRGAPTSALQQCCESGSDQALAIFVQRPDPGHVKTWLIDLFGEQRAASLYRRNVEEVLHTAQTAPVDARVYVFFTPEEARADIQTWLGDSCMLIAQQGADDHERRANALDTLFNLGIERLVLLGPHCPAIQRHHIASALRILREDDAVLGPTDDGGCYLVGIRPEHRDLIVGLQWEPDGVFAEIVSAFSSAGIRYQCLETLKDLDSVEDLSFNWALGLVQE